MKRSTRNNRRGRTTRRPTTQGVPGSTILKLVAAGVSLGLVAAVLILWPWPQPSGSQLTVIAQIDSNTVAPDMADFDDLASIAYGMAMTGGGTLTVQTGAGDRPSVSYEHSLTILRDGRLESDKHLREQAVDAILAEALAAITTADYNGTGQSLDGVLWALANDRPPAGTEWNGVVYSSTLPVVDPVDIRALMAAEPATAVALLPATSIPDLTGLRLTWIIAGTTGTQEPITVATAQWRNSFLTAYIAATHAELVGIQESGRTGAALPGAPEGVPVDNLADPTPQPPQPPKPAEVYTVTFDDPATFVPNEAILLTDEALLRPELDALAVAWQTREYSEIVCYGRVADFPDEPGVPDDITLSEQRAQVITSLLLADYGISARAVGLGQEHPLPGDPRGAHQRSVICEATPVHQ